MGGGPQPEYERFEKGQRARVRATREIGIVKYFYYWGGGILVKLEGINNPNDPKIGFHDPQGEFWQVDLAEVK